MRKKLISLGFAVILALTTFTSSALAHECMILSRSDVGDLKAQSSANWLKVATRTEAFGFIGGILQLDPLSPNQLAWADAKAASMGVPNDLVIFVGKVTLADGSGAAKTGVQTNGKGVDHLIDLLGKIYVEALKQPA